MTVMLCAKCHQKEATVHFTTVVDGTEEETVHLCKDCAPPTGFSARRTRVKQKCLACGVEKAPSIKEVYPYPEEDRIIDEPIDPLITVDCQGAQDWRVVRICYHCFHKLDVDMWISERCWQSLNPITPFEQLPRLETK